MSAPEGRNGTSGPFGVPLTVNTTDGHNLPDVDQETIEQFFNGSWFQAVDSDVTQQEDDELQNLVPITGSVRAPNSVTLYCRNLQIANVLLERLNGICFQGRTLQIFKLAGVRVPPEQRPPCALDRLVHPFNKTMFAKNNRVESEHSSRAPFRARTAPASFYDVLNISRAADAKEIKEAFAKCRKAAQQEEKNEKIIEACQAYETLSDPEKRSAYDHRLSQFACDVNKAKQQKGRIWSQLRAFLIRHIQDIRQGHVRRVRCTERQGPSLRQQASHILTRVRGADLLVVFPFLPEVWICGTPAQRTQMERMLKEAAEEADGHRAPPDGVVLKVPPVHAGRLDDKREQLMKEVKDLTCSNLTFCDDRIILRSGDLPKAVALLQKHVVWRAEVTGADGQKLDAWQYSLRAERALARPNEELVPEREPDPEEVDAILHRESGAGTCAERALQALDAMYRGSRSMSFTLLRLLTSRVVHHAVAKDPKANTKILNQFVVTVVRTWSIFGLRRPLYEFGKNSLCTVLWGVPNMIQTTHLQRDFEEKVNQMVPGAHQWCPWNVFWQSHGAMDIHKLVTQALTSTAAQLQEPVAVGEGWSSDSHITNFILQHGCGRLFHVDDKNGLFRRQDLLGMNWFGLPQFMAAATAAAATHRHTTSKAKPQAPPEAARSEPPAPKASSQAHSRRSRSRSVSVSRSRSAPITVAAKRDMTGQWKDLTAEKVSKLLATQSVELLLFAAQKENLFRKGNLMPELVKNITDSTVGSVEDLCRLLAGRNLLQAIHTVSKLGDLNWDEESLLSLLHAGLHEALKTEDVENKATLRLLEQVQSPFNQLLLRDDCSVIPLLGKKQDRRVLRKLCELIGSLPVSSEIPSEHRETMMTSLEATANQSTSFTILGWIVKCFKSGRLEVERMMTLVATCFHRISQQGIEKMEQVEEGVPEAMDCTVQHFRSFGLHRFIDEKAPPEVTIFLCGAVVRLDAPDLWQNSLFTEERLKDLEASQLFSCLKLLVGRGDDGDEHRRIFKAALVKSIGSQASEAEALMMVRAAHELKEVKLLVLQSAQYLLLKAVKQDSLLECIEVLQTLVTHGIDAIEKVSQATADRFLELGRKMSAASLENSLMELRTGMHVLHQQGCLRRISQDLAGLPCLRGVASRARCNDLALAQIISMLLASESHRRKPALGLAEVLCGVPSDQHSKYPSDRTDYRLLVRVTGANEGEKHILPGLYTIVGENDNCPVYKRVMPYLEQKDCQVHMYFWASLSMWYIGPSVGHDLVWAYAPGKKSDKKSFDRDPPRRGWHWQENSSVQKSTISIKCFTLETAHQGAPAQSREDHGEATQAAMPKPYPRDPREAKRAPPEPPIKKARPEEKPKPKEAPKKLPHKARPCESPLAKAQTGPPKGPPVAPPGLTETEPPVAPPGLTETEKEFYEWLQKLDPKNGTYLVYFDKFKEHYDADLEQLKLARHYPDDVAPAQLPENFFEEIEVKTTGHKMVLKKAIRNLPKELS